MGIPGYKQEKWNEQNNRQNEKKSPGMKSRCLH